MRPRRNPPGVAVRVDVDDAHRGELFGAARAYVGDQVVGVAPFTFTDSAEGGRRVVRVGIVRVAEASRRKGIGTAILSALRSELGANKVELGYAVSPEGARLAKAYKRTLLPRGNPAWTFWRKPRPSMSGHLRAFTRVSGERDEALRSLAETKRLPVSASYMRGDFVEVRCENCMARGVIEPGRGVRVNHRKPECDSPHAVTLVEIHARRKRRKDES